MTWPGKEKLQETEREEQNELTLHLVGLPTLYSVAPSTHKLLCSCTFCLPFYSGRSLPSFASSLWMALTEALSPSPSISMLSHTGMYSVPPYLLTNIQSIIRPACVSCCTSETVTKWKNILYIEVIPTPSFYCTKAVHWQSSSYWSVAYIVVESISPTSTSEYYFHVRQQAFLIHIWKFSYLSCCIWCPKPWCFHLCLQYRIPLRERKRVLLASKSVNLIYVLLALLPQNLGCQS